MGLFSKLFNGNSETKEEKQLPWLDVTELSQLKAIKEKSETKTQIIFKHSIRCGISRMVMNQFVKDFNFEAGEVDLYYIDIINYREVSNAVANTFNVVHESPQLLIVKNGAAVAHESHGSINSMDLKAYI